MKNLPKFLPVILLVVLLVTLACGMGPLQFNLWSTATPMPTSTPTITPTPLPTSTPRPTATPKPTATPELVEGVDDFVEFRDISVKVVNVYTTGSYTLGVQTANAEPGFTIMIVTVKSPNSKADFDQIDPTWDCSMEKCDVAISAGSYYNPWWFWASTEMGTLLEVDFAFIVPDDYVKPVFHFGPYEVELKPFLDNNNSTSG